MEDLSANQRKIVLRMVKLGICVEVGEGDSYMTEHKLAQFEKYCNKLKNRQKGTSIRELSHFLSLHCIHQDPTGRCLSAAFKAGLPVSLYHNPTNSTPLHVGTARGFPAVVQIAIDAGVDISARDALGMSPLFYAVQGKMNGRSRGTEADYYKIFQMIAEAKGGIDQCLYYTTRCGQRRPLILFACEAGAALIARDLINTGADVNVRDEMECDIQTQFWTGVGCLGETPLHCAVKSGNLKLVKLLLKNGANTRMRTFGEHATLPVEKIFNGGYNMRIANEIFRWELDHNINCNDTPAVSTGRMHRSDVNIENIRGAVKAFLETGEITGQVSSKSIFRLREQNMGSFETVKIEKVENDLESRTIEMKKCSKCGKEQPDLKKCSRCKAVHYCNSICQKDDWHEHKNVCTKT